MSHIDRQTGRTTRLILEALLEASRGQDTIIVEPTYALSRAVERMLQDFARPIRNCSIGRNCVILPNGSRVTVITDKDSEKFYGSNHRIFKDTL